MLEDELLKKPRGLARNPGAAFGGPGKVLAAIGRIAATADAMAKPRPSPAMCAGARHFYPILPAQCHAAGCRKDFSQARWAAIHAPDYLGDLGGARQIYRLLRTSAWASPKIRLLAEPFSITDKQAVLYAPLGMPTRMPGTTPKLCVDAAFRRSSSRGWRPSSLHQPARHAPHAQTFEGAS